MRLDLKKVKVPVFNLAAREDHIAPAKSVFHGSKASAGRSNSCSPGSGHIAGVVNPVTKPKYQYLDGRAGRGRAPGLDRQGARRRRHLVALLVLVDREAGAEARSRREIPAPASSPPLADAPGTYVLERA